MIRPALQALLILVALALAGCVHEEKRPARSALPPGKVGVVGAVVREGLLDYRPGMTLLEAVREAGGITPQAAPDRTTITRFSSGLAASATIRLDQVADGRVPDPPLEEGDVVTVPSIY